MAALKTAAFSLASLALLRGAGGQDATVPDGKPMTAGAVLEAFNLFRNGRIDGGLNNLAISETFKYDGPTIVKFLQVGDERTTCAEQSSAKGEGLLIKLTADEATKFDIKSLLDKQLDDGLDKLIAQAGSSNPTYNDLAESNLAYLSSDKATKVGCALTTGCELQGSKNADGTAQPHQFFFCVFDGLSGAPAVTKAFADALKARKAVISVSQLTSNDADTPLYSSSASKAAFSALAVLSAGLSAVLLL